MLALVYVFSYFNKEKLIIHRFHKYYSAIGDASTKFPSLNGRRVDYMLIK